MTDFENFFNDTNNKLSLVLFFEEKDALYFNFEILEKTNLGSKNVAILKKPLNLLSQISNLTQGIFANRVFIRDNTWEEVTLDSSDLETLELSLKPYIPLLSISDFRSKQKSLVIGPCQSRDNIQADYQFALCDFLDELEDRITRRTLVNIRHWTDSVELINQKCLMVNTEFINKTEYLILDNGSKIRLDRVFDFYSICRS